MNTSVEVFAAKYPELTRFALRNYLRVDRALRRYLRRVDRPIRELLNTLDYRAPARATMPNGMSVVVPWNDDGGRAICENGYYEPSTVHVFEALISAGMVVIDIGANVGQYSLVASGRVGPTGEVHAFEPDPVTFEWLSRNVSLNGLTNIHLNQRALFSENTEMDLYLASVRDTGSNSLVGEPWIFGGRTEKVSCITLDSYLESKPVSHVDVVKLDVEGAELAVLEGSEQLLRSRKPPTLIIEFEEERQRLAGTSCAALAEFLTDRGYKLFRLGPPLETYVVRPDEPSTSNVLAIPEARLAATLQAVTGGY